MMLSGNAVSWSLYLHQFILPVDAVAIEPRVDICHIKDCVNALKDIPGSFKDCVAAVAGEGLEVLKDIKCPFTALSAFKDVKECVGCTHIGECAYEDTGVLDPTQRACGGPNGVVTHTGPNRCAQYNATAEAKAGDRLWQGSSLYRFHCGETRVLMAENRCYFNCTKCTAQCGDTCDPNAPVKKIRGLDATEETASPIWYIQKRDDLVKPRQAKFNPRTLAQGGYESKCTANGSAIVSTNSNDPRDLQHWRIGKSNYDDIINPNDGEDIQCDHVLELWEMPAFFNIAFDGTWGYGNVHAQDLWMKIFANLKDGCTITKVRNILNDPSNLIYVDSRINKLKNKALQRQPRIETWTDKDLMGTYQYLYYIYGPYYRTAEKLAKLFDEEAGSIPNTDDGSYSKEWLFYIANTMMHARIKLEEIMKDRGKTHLDSNSRQDIQKGVPQGLGDPANPWWLPDGEELPAEADPSSDEQPTKMRKVDIQLIGMQNDIGTLDDYTKSALVDWDSQAPATDKGGYAASGDPMYLETVDIMGNLPGDERFEDTEE